MNDSTLFEIDLAGGPASRHYAKLLEPLAGNIDTAFPWNTLDPANYEPSLVERARVGWTESAFNEFCTAAAMGQLVETMGVAKVPLDLWAIATSFPLEELLHVELCSRVAMELGGGAPLVYSPRDLVLEFNPGLTPLQRCNELIIRLCCVGEVFSLPMLVGAMRAATHPLTKAVLRQIVKDESMHGQLGWMYLDWVGPDLDRCERRRLGACAQDTARGLKRLWERLDAGPERTPEPGFSDMGWMESVAYLERSREALEVDVFGRLGTYGI